MSEGSSLCEYMLHHQGLGLLCVLDFLGSLFSFFLLH